MKLRIWICVLLVAGVASAQELSRPATPWVSVTGDAEIKVAPDRVTITLGVQTRDASLAAATAQNAKTVAAVLAAVKHAGVDPSDMQTDYIGVDTGYDTHLPTLVAFYDVQKNISVTVKDVNLFEPVLMAALGAGANHIHNVEFSTSNLRKHRDEARAMAVKAASEKASDMAAAAGLKIKRATSISSYSYGSGSWYGRYWGRGYYANAQNVIQEAGGGGGPQGTIALGKISVTASVTMTFEFE